MMKYFITLISFLTILFIVNGCGSDEAPRKETVRPVKAMSVGRLTDIAGKGFPAVTKANQETPLSFKVGGTLIQYNVVEGARVKKGELVARIDPRDYRIAEQSARARYEQTKAEAQRYERLWKKGSVAKNDYDVKMANYLEAKAAWEKAKNDLNDTKLYAPFDGFYGAELADVGEEVKPYQPVTVLYDLSKIEIYTTIPEQLAVRFKDFESFSVVFDTYPNKIFSATLKEMGKTPTAEGYPLYLYLVQNGKEKISAGMSCKITVNLKKDSETSNEIIVPFAAVFEGETDKQPAVWIIDDRLKVRKRFVTLGGFAGKEHVIVKSGLKPGERIVAAGSRRLVEGQHVKILKQEDFK